MPYLTKRYDIILPQALKVSCITGQRGGQKWTAVPKQMVEITTEMLFPDSYDEYQLS